MERQKQNKKVGCPAILVVFAVLILLVFLKV